MSVWYLFWKIRNNTLTLYKDFQSSLIKQGRGDYAQEGDVKDVISKYIRDTIFSLSL